MSFKGWSAMEQKRLFITEAFAGGVSFAELCRSFGISRTLGYKYLNRFLQFGEAGLEERSRAPHRQWNKTSDLVEKLILELRCTHPRWGAITIHSLLEGAIARGCPRFPR